MNANINLLRSKRKQEVEFFFLSNVVVTYELFLFCNVERICPINHRDTGFPRCMQQIDSPKNASFITNVRFEIPWNSEGDWTSHLFKNANKLPQLFSLRQGSQNFSMAMPKIVFKILRPQEILAPLINIFTI